MDEKRLISVDELRAAGALDVPPAWRRSLGSENEGFRGLFDDLNDEPESADDPAGDDADGEDDDWRPPGAARKSDPPGR